MLQNRVFDIWGSHNDAFDCDFQVKAPLGSKSRPQLESLAPARRGLRELRRLLLRRVSLSSAAMRMPSPMATTTVSAMDFHGLLAVQKPIDSKVLSTPDSNLSETVLGLTYRIVRSCLTR